MYVRSTSINRPFSQPQVEHFHVLALPLWLDRRQSNIRTAAGCLSLPTGSVEPVRTHIPSFTLYFSTFPRRVPFFSIFPRCVPFPSNPEPGAIILPGLIVAYPSRVLPDSNDNSSPDRRDEAT